MDQIEFENCIEKMKHRNDEGDYKTASKIADKIPWDEVNDVNVLMFAATIYEKANNFKDAKMILEYAYEIAPVKNRLYFALCLINTKCKELKDATSYYVDFCNAFPDDNRKLLLKYQLLKAKDAPVEQLKRILIEYVEEEKDEEMLFEIALLSDKLGERDEVIKYCDYVVNFFGVKKVGFGKNALLLKQKYISLLESEKKLLKDADKEYLDNENQDVVYKNPPNLYNATKMEEEKINIPVEKIERETVSKEQEKINELFKNEDDTLDETKVDSKPRINYTPDIQSYDYKEKNDMAFLGKDKVADKEKLKKLIKELKEEEVTESNAFNTFRKLSFKRKGRFNKMKFQDSKLNMIIEARSKEEGIDIAIKELNYIHEVIGDKVVAAKASAYNMNEKGFKYYADKIEGKDLIIENAGKLKDEIIDDIEEYIINNKGKSILALIDIINNFDKLATDRPAFIQRFDIYSVLSERPQETLVATDDDISLYKGETKRVEEPKKIIIDKKVTKEETPVYENKVKTTIEKPTIAKPKKEPEENVNIKKTNIRKDNEMDVEEFVEECKAYAKSIDCVMLGNAVPALYERVEEMQSEHIVLTKENAIALIEEAADRAEKPKLFSKPKYDKEGCLILKEEHFIF